jgi:hypothetical protein
MPIRRSPNGARHTPPQAGRDRPEWVVAINRNAWSQSIVTSGRDHPVRAQVADPGQIQGALITKVRLVSASGQTAS